MKLIYLGKSFFAVLVGSAVAGCVAPAMRADSQASNNYFAQQVYADNSALQSWQEMRSESEIKGVFEEDWADKLQRMEKANEARSRKGPKAATDKGAKAGKAADQPAPAKPRQDGKSQGSPK